MPKKLKLDLNGLRIQSFVTSLDKRDKSKVRGGITASLNCPDCTEGCPTQTCYTNCGTCNTCTCDTCETNCGTCVTCATCPTCYWKVNTCAPDCTEIC
jgi:hypothetical protein